MRTSLMAMAILLLVSFCLAFAPDAEAARLGGGRSFGSQPSMRQTAPAPAPAFQHQQPMQSRQPMGGPQSGAMQQRGGGLFGGMGGMGGILGGVLAGTLLGSLLSGGDFSGGGFLDILLLGLLVYFVFRLLRRGAPIPTRQDTAAAGAGAGSSWGASSQQGAPGWGGSSPNDAWGRQQDGGHSGSGGWQPQQGAPGWGGMERSADAGRGISLGKPGDAPAAGGSSDGWEDLRNYPSRNDRPVNDGPALPPDFDAEEFLRGAKAAYVRLQKAWDNRDLGDIAQFANQAVMDAVREQLREDPTPSTTEIMLVNASILDFAGDGVRERVQVYFDVLMREDPSLRTPSNVREIWHFVREGRGGMWKLDGIQQVA